MKLPFTREQFLEVFAEYNTAIWPAQIIAIVLGIAAVALIVTKHKSADKFTGTFLALQWLWIGALYHIKYFSEINKAAYLFGALFLIQGVLFLISGVFKNNLRFSSDHKFTGAIGWIFILYALVFYMAIGYALGHRYPYTPVFGVVPCPAVIFTFGLLLWAGKQMPKYLIIIPVIWAVIGTVAALKLEIYQDFGLTVSAVITCIIVARYKMQAGKVEVGV
ncbi:MAG: DUF6064 family protein [Armatimonadota bacterium]